MAGDLPAYPVATSRHAARADPAAALKGTQLLFWRVPRASPVPFPSAFAGVVAARLLLRLESFRGSLDAVHFHCGLPVHP